MRKLLILAVVAALSFWGCSENSNITEPTDIQNQQSVLNKTLDKTMEVVFAADGSTIEFELADGDVTCAGTFEIAAGSLSKDTKVKISMISGETGLNISPAIEFETAAVLDMTFSGVDIDKNADYKFVYYDGSNEVEIENDGVKVNLQKESIALRNGLLDHCSRFGFTK